MSWAAPLHGRRYLHVRGAHLWVVLAAALAGCASLPKAPILSGDPVLTGEQSERVVLLPPCAGDLPDDADLYCRIRLNDLYNALVATELFREVSIEEPGDSDSRVVVDIHDFKRTPYWATPGHNPGFLLLSLGIPFWWTEHLGFRFSVYDPSTNREVLVDTRWSGTAVMWSLASFLNVLPSRTFESTSSQDTSRLRAALVGE